MADIQDVEGLGEIDAVVEDIQQQSAESTEAEPAKTKLLDDLLPAKWKGKQIEEIVNIAKSQDGIIGKQAVELGEVRRLADELIKSQLKPTQQAEQKEVDFFENPQEAIRKAVETNPEVQMAKQFAIQAQQAQAKAAFERKHPDAGSILQDAQFGEWIQSSKIRTDLFQKANSFDVDAADELFSTYKQLKAVKAAQTQSKVSEVEKSARDSALKAAAVETGGTGESSQKIWSRAKIMHMRLYEKAKFESNREEIERAYREGRVK